MADIVFFDGQAISATQLNAAFAEKIDNDADASALTSLAGGPLARTLENRFSDTVNVLDYLSTTPDGTSPTTPPVSKLQSMRRLAMRGATFPLQSIRSARSVSIWFLIAIW